MHAEIEDLQEEERQGKIRFLRNGRLHLITLDMCNMIYDIKLLDSKCVTLVCRGAGD